MQTQWGDLAVCDAHVHFFSHNFFRLLSEQKPRSSMDAMGPLLGWEMPPHNPAELAARWVQELDSVHITRSALIASLTGDEASVESAVNAYPQRFVGFFIVNPCSTDAVEHTLQRLNTGALRVPCLFPAMHQYSLHDPRTIAVIEAVAERPAPVVFVHCGVLSVGIRKKLGLPSPFDMRFSNPIDLHGLALRFPDVSFILPHFGAGYFREALMVADLCPNVYLDTSSSNSWMRYEGWSLERVFERALAVAGPRRLLFGTDSSFFPRGWNAAVFRAQCDALATLGVDASTAAAILGGNFARLFPA